MTQSAVSRSVQRGQKEAREKGVRLDEWASWASPLPVTFKSLGGSMKRDLDLVRKILIEMESHEHGFYSSYPEIENYTKDQIGYHAFLMKQAGLIDAADRNTLSSKSPDAIPLNLTWLGHEFLESTKDPSLWAKAKKIVIEPIGGIAFDVLIEWLKKEAKLKLGIQ